MSCASIFTTHETAALEETFMVQGTNANDITPLSRDKLFLSINASCGHRKDNINDASGLTDTILNKIIRTTKNGQIARHKIIEVVLEVLDNFDASASTMYRAYHPNVKSVTS